MSTCFIHFFHTGAIFCCSPAIFVSSMYTDNNDPCFRRTNRHSQCGTFSHPSSNRTSSNCLWLSHNNLPVGVRINFVQEVSQDLQCFPMILAICVMVDESKCLDIPIWEFSIICEHLPFFLGISRYCVSCLSCTTWQSGDDIHDFSCCHLRCWRSLFSENCRRPRLVFHNVASDYNPTFVFLVLRLQFSIFQMTYVH